MNPSALAFASLLLFAGCLSTRVPPVSTWPISSGERSVASSVQKKFGVTRLAQVTVCSPYDVRTMQVFRSDNTLTADAYNLFAALPSRLLREPARILLASSGRFASVVSATSSANAQNVAELNVTDFHLDCAHDAANPDRREAVVELTLTILDANRDIAATLYGTFRADARDGDYGAAFSKAFAGALRAALAGL